MKFTNLEIKVLKELAHERIELNEEREYYRKENEKVKPNRICDFLIEETNKCNSHYWKNKKCDKEKCPWKNHGNYAMAVGDQGNRLR